MSVKTESIIGNLIGAIKESQSGTSAYDCPAEVLRVEDDTVWVHIAGGVDETPVRKTVNCSKGDMVQIRVGGGDAWIVGNATAPPTDDATAIKVGKDVEVIKEFDQVITREVEGVKKIAGDTNQYFWHTEEGTDTGAHITEIPQEDFLADPSNGGGNLLARSNGIAVRDGLTELAVFGATGSRIGKENESNVQLTSRGFKMVDMNDLAYFSVEDKRDSNGILHCRDNFTATFLTSSRTFPLSFVPKQDSLIVKVNGTETSDYTVVSDGIEAWLHISTLVTGTVIAEYDTTSAYAVFSSFGSNLANFGGVASTRGIGNEPTGLCSSADGRDCEANANYSHAQNLGTQAIGYAQTVIGKYNEAKGVNFGAFPAYPAFIIGNGSKDSNRSNAFEVNWNGDAKAYGNVYKNGTEELVSASQGSGSDSVSVANSTSFVDIGVETYLDVGLYILVASINFPAGTGRRGLRWYYGGDTNWAESAVSQNAVTGTNVNTRMQVTRILKVNTGVTMKIQAFQNSGSALTCDIYYRYIKLA